MSLQEAKQFLILTKTLLETGAFFLFFIFKIEKNAV